MAALAAAAGGPIPWIGVGLAAATLASIWVGWWLHRRPSPPSPWPPRHEPAPTPHVEDGPLVLTAPLSHAPAAAMGARSLTLLAIAVEQRAPSGESPSRAAGEPALREVAHTVQRMLRSGDTFVREDGLLVALIPGVDLQRSRMLVMRLARAVDALRVVTHRGQEQHLAITVGRAFMPQDGTSLEALLQTAIKDVQQRRGGAGDGSPLQRLSRAVPMIPN